MAVDGIIYICTDGSCIGNGRAISKCGWAVKLIYNGHQKIKSGGFVGKTNNYAEMYAVLVALQSITDKTKPTKLYSDSKYVIETLNGRFRVGANKELWNQIFAEYREFEDITSVWIKGHNGDLHNEEVDRLAGKEAQNAERKRD